MLFIIKIAIFLIKGIDVEFKILSVSSLARWRTNIGGTAVILLLGGHNKISVIIS